MGPVAGRQRRRNQNHGHEPSLFASGSTPPCHSSSDGGDLRRSQVVRSNDEILDVTEKLPTREFVL